jgi:hypothetical protein
MRLHSRALFGRGCSRGSSIVLTMLVLGGCRASVAVSPDVTPTDKASEVPPIVTSFALEIRALSRDLLSTAGKNQVAELTPGNLNHARLWSTISPVIDASVTARRAEIGHSVEGRPLYVVEFGRGVVRVLLWSQMHGDEPTGTLALADLIAYVIANPNDPLVRRIQERLSVAIIPMLNPDGAQRQRRENASGIDLNRDARKQRAPEARALAAFHARLSPEFGFNLHNMTRRIDEDGHAVAVALLVPPHEAKQSDMATSTRAKRIAATMRLAAEPLVDGRVTLYDETYNEIAFGNALQSWGTSTVLLETGDWETSPGAAYLRQVNFVLILIALDAIATGSFQRAPLDAYESLPVSRRGK